MDRSERFRGLKPEHLRALVVASPGTIEIIPAYRRLEWRRFPQINRIDGLHIIMPIYKHSGLPGSLEPLAINERVTCCLYQMHLLEAHLSQLLRSVLRGPANVTRVFRQRTDARNAQPVYQIVKKTAFVLRYVGFQLCHKNSVLSLVVNPLRFFYLTPASGH